MSLLAELSHPTNVHIRQIPSCRNRQQLANKVKHLFLIFFHLVWYEIDNVLLKSVIKSGIDFIIFLSPNSVFSHWWSPLGASCRQSKADGVSIAAVKLHCATLFVTKQTSQSLVVGSGNKHLWRCPYSCDSFYSLSICTAYLCHALFLSTHSLANVHLK